MPKLMPYLRVRGGVGAVGVPVVHTILREGGGGVPEWIQQAALASGAVLGVVRWPAGQQSTPVAQGTAPGGRPPRR